MNLLLWALVGCALSSALEVDSAAPRAEPSSTHWKIQQEEARKGLPQSEWTGSLSPQWDPYVHVERGYGHGNVTEWGGDTFKWQQVAMGVSIGIPIDEWDDKTHRQSVEFVAWTDPEQGHSYDLERRANGRPFWERNCRAVIACAKHFRGAIDLENGWAQAVHAAMKFKAHYESFYNWAHRHPYSVSITISTATGLVSGYALGKSHGGATAQDNDQLAACSSSNSEEDACILAFTQSAARPYQASDVHITLPDGHILAFSAMVYQKTKFPPNDMCGVVGDAP